MEIREVKIEEYWPQIVKGTAEFGEIAAALNPEFNKLAKCIYDVLNESFIATASEYGVRRWENILGINPAAGASLDDRKAAILTYLNVKTPYTWRVLKQMLVPILGGEDKFVMEYINDEAKLILHTDRLDDAMLTTVDELLSRVLPQNMEVVRYNLTMDISWRDLDPALPPELAGKYNECKTVDEMLVVDTNCRNDLTSDGAFLYPIEALETGYDGSGQGLFKGNKNIKKLWDKATLKNLKRGGQAWSVSHGMFNGSSLEELPSALTLENLRDGQHMFYGTKIKSIPASVNLSRLSNGASMFQNCTMLTRCDSVLNMQNISRSGQMFYGTQFDAESACRILNNFPAKKLDMTIGIHVDHQNDEEVLAAIADAEAKGWTLTVQWNGTPTSGISTMDLEEIWCKVTENEHGEYTDENGNRCMLEWGHYVTDTSGYKLFFSLVEAEQYFKLTKVTENE